MADVKWIKLTTDMFDNRKIKHLRRLPDGNNIVLLWIMLLTMAGRCNAGGMIFLTENIPYTPKMLADELDLEENTVKLGIEALEQLNMIVTDNGYFTIASWEEYQNIDKLAEIREKNRISQQKTRAKRKLLQSDNDVSRDCHVTVTCCHAIEEEREEEKEKEIQSFVLADKETAKREFLGGELGKGVVLMSDEQFDDLCDKLSLDEMHHYFGIVADCELKGKKYKRKTHYQAILDMVAKDRRTENNGAK